ncbi:MAG: hypothetical protein AAF513_06680, partial [Pseudomonadota bacterium]
GVGRRYRLRAIGFVTRMKGADQGHRTRGKNGYEVADKHLAKLTNAAQTRTNGNLTKPKNL